MIDYRMHCARTIQKFTRRSIATNFRIRAYTFWVDTSAEFLSELGTIQFMLFGSLCPTQIIFRLKCHHGMCMPVLYDSKYHTRYSVLKKVRDQKCNRMSHSHAFWPTYDWNRSLMDHPYYCSWLSSRECSDDIHDPLHFILVSFNTFHCYNIA